MYPYIDFESILGYPNKSVAKWSRVCPRFEGLVIPHVIEFFMYIGEAHEEH
jgi:hypothetical protein